MNCLSVSFVSGKLPLCYGGNRQLRYEEPSGLLLRMYCRDGKRRHIYIHSFTHSFMEKHLLKDYQVLIDRNIIKKSRKNILM